MHKLTVHSGKELKDGYTALKVSHADEEGKKNKKEKPFVLVLPENHELLEPELEYESLGKDVNTGEQIFKAEEREIEEIELDEKHLVELVADLSARVYQLEKNKNRSFLSKLAGIEDEDDEQEEKEEKAEKESDDDDERDDRD